MSYNEVNQTKSKTYSFLGLYNRARSRKQPQGDNGGMITLASCQNIDIDDEGAISSRTGYAKSLNLLNVVSAFSVASYTHAYAIANGMLKLINSDLTVTDLGAVPNSECEWLEVGNVIFLSIGYIIDNDKLLPWKVLQPKFPDYTVVSGRMPKGQYMLLATDILPDGRESVSSEVVTVVLPENSAIELIGTANKIIYMTDPNGGVFYEMGYQINTINQIPDGGKAIVESLILNEPLPDQIDKIAFFQGSIYCSVYDKDTNTSCLLWSVYMLSHVFDLVNQVISGIAGEIRMLYGTPDALLIGTDREIMALSDNGLAKLADYGVPGGKPLKVNRDGTILFQSLRGVCTFPFQNLTVDKFTAPLGDCKTAFVNQGGFEKFITITDGGSNPAEDSINF